MNNFHNSCFSQKIDFENVSEKISFQSLSNTNDCIVVPKKEEKKYEIHLFETSTCGKSLSVEGDTKCALEMCKGILENSMHPPNSPVTVCSVEELNTPTTDKDICYHNIVDDNIDITPDKSMKIRYCEICLVTFN
jgi:hypothetical protein